MGTSGKLLRRLMCQSSSATLCANVCFPPPNPSSPGLTPPPTAQSIQLQLKIVSENTRVAYKRFQLILGSQHRPYVEGKPCLKTSTIFINLFQTFA